MIDLDSTSSESSFESRAPLVFESVRRMLTTADPRQAVRQALIELDQRSRGSLSALYDVLGDRLNRGEVFFTFNANLSPPQLPPDSSGLLSITTFRPWVDTLLAGRSVIYASHELPLCDQVRVEAHGLRSIMVVPILLRNELRGVLVTAREHELADVTDDTRALVELMAETIGVALERHRSATGELRSDGRLNAILAYAYDTIAVVDQTGTILFHSPSFGGGGSALFEDSNGENALAFVHPHDLPRIQKVMAELVQEPGGMRSVEMRLRQTDGSWRYYDAIGTNQLNNPDINGIVVTAHDITERKELEQRLNWQALHDPLTNLANRSLLLNDLGHALSRIERNDEMVALLYLDIDGFKEVNDSLGHPAGDQLLILIGERLQSCVRAGETVARLGGDEFVVLLEGLARPADAERAASRILTALRVPVYLDSQPIAITSSIGISVAANRSIDPTEMLIEADTALYAAKRIGRARFVRYSLDLRRTTSNAATDESDPRSSFTIS